MKPCRICGEQKELQEFGTTKRLEFYPDGHINWCFECLKLYKRYKRQVKKDSQHECKITVWKGETVEVRFD